MRRFGFVLMALLLIGGVAFAVSVYRECSAFGHSRGYCVAMVAR